LSISANEKEGRTSVSAQGACATPLQRIYEVEDLLFDLFENLFGTSMWQKVWIIDVPYGYLALAFGASV
jgi:hypothetical protein